MKYATFFLLIFYIGLNGCHNTPEYDTDLLKEDSLTKYLFKKEDSIPLNSQLINNSIYCVSYDGKRYITEGTAFIIEKHNKYYLASNYHIIAGRAANDTTEFLDRQGFKEPNNIKVRFHSTDGYFIDTIYNLFDNSNNRLFISSSLKVGVRVLDIALLPINRFPKKASISIINIDKMDNNWVISPKTKLYLFGYRYSVHALDQWAKMDTVRTIPDSNFQYKDKYILAFSSHSLKGNSGAPVYIIDKGKMVFIGIHSETLPLRDLVIFPEITLNKVFNRDVSVILSAKNFASLGLD